MKRGFLIVIIGMVFIATGSCQPQPEAVSGAEGIGDPYYPQLGNAGYDVQKYEIIMDVIPESNTVKARTIITAKATQRLSSLNLDFQGLEVDSVKVNRSNATFTHQGVEMTITPEKPISLNRTFTVEVTYHGEPSTSMSSAIPVQVGWFHSADGSINILTEPDGASTWFPNNNHPRDKALYHFEITVPDPWIVAATGTLQKTVPDDGHTTYIFDLDSPAASYLAAINIDKYTLKKMDGPDGVVIRNYFPDDYPESLQKNFDVLPEMLAYLSSVYGPYPFKEYGVVIASPETELCKSPTADETQTLSIHCPGEEMATEAVIVHELAHQWFGDSVSLENWKDIWLKEGMATYAQWLWATKGKDLEVVTRVVKVQMIGYFPSSSTGEPPIHELYRAEVYKGGALVFHALRLQVGDEAFFKIIHTYLERYRDSNAGTDEFIALSEEISGQDLNHFFDEWLLDNDLPELAPMKQ